MRVETRDFGPVELDERRIVDFVEPVLGFEDRRRFALLGDPALGEEISCLQSLEERTLCFVLLNPQALPLQYAPAVPARTEAVLGPGEYECWVIAVLGEDLGKSTVNLKSPVLINWETRRGMQLILDQDYPVRYPLLGETGVGTC